MPEGLAIRQPYEEQDSTKYYCDACGKLRTDPECGTWLALTVEVSVDNPIYWNFAQRMMGPYDLNRRYNICWECYLRSLGIKPNAA